MTVEVLDLRDRAATIGALAAEVASCPGGAAALAPLAAEVQALAPTLVSAPVADGPTEWVGHRDETGLAVYGPGGISVVTEGVAGPTAAVHVTVGERSLTVWPQAPAGTRARLVDGTTVLGDATVSITSGLQDHLSTADAERRAAARARRAVQALPENPYDTVHEPGTEGLDVGGIASVPTPSGSGAAGAAVAGAAAAAALGAGAAALARRRGRRLAAPGHETDETAPDETAPDQTAPESATSQERPAPETRSPATTPARQPTPSPAWTATHVVPPGGLAARAVADPTAAVAAALEPGVQLRLLRRWGDWAEVDAANGWTGWVDGRRLAPVAAT